MYNQYKHTQKQIITSGGSKVVYRCQFEGSLECIYMGYLGLFIHSGWGMGLDLQEK